MSGAKESDVPPAEEMAAHYEIERSPPMCAHCQRVIHAGDKEPKNENADTVVILVPYASDRMATFYCEDHVDIAVARAEVKSTVAVVRGPLVTQFDLENVYGIWGGSVELVYPSERRPASAE